MTLSTGRTFSWGMLLYVAFCRHLIKRSVQWTVKTSRHHIQGSTGYGLRKNCWAAPPNFGVFESNETDHTPAARDRRLKCPSTKRHLATKFTHIQQFSETTDPSEYSVHMGPPAPTYFVKEGVMCRAFCWILHFRDPTRARCNLREIFTTTHRWGTVAWSARAKPANWERIGSAPFGFVTMHACYRRTDRWTDGQTYDFQHRGSIAMLAR